MKLLKIVTIFTIASLLVCSCAGKEEYDPIGIGPTPPEPTGYAIGDYYKSGDVEGIVFYLSDEEGEHGLIVSLQEWNDVWSTEAVETGALSPESSQYNMERIKSRSNWKVDYPAFRICDALNSSRVIGWVLPCNYDLERLYQGFNGGPGAMNAEAQAAFNKALTDNGGTPITHQIYWTSTEYAYFGAYGIDFGPGELCYPSDGDKDKENAIRAVKAF